MNLTRGEREKLQIALAVSVARTTGSDALHLPATRPLAWNAYRSRSSRREVNNAHAEFLMRACRSPRARQVPPHHHAVSRPLLIAAASMLRGHARGGFAARASGAPREVAEVRRCAPLLVAEDDGRSVSAVLYRVTSGGQRSRICGFESRLPRVPLQDSGA